MLKPLSLTLILCLSLTAWAAGETESFTVVDKAPRSAIGVNASFTAFSLEGGEIVGSGISATFDHNFNKKLGIQLSLSTALQSSGANAFNGFGTYLTYSIWNTCCGVQNSYMLDGEPLAEESNSKQLRVLAGIGVNQFFFNGSEAVYSLSGLGGTVQAAFQVWRVPVVLGVHSSMIQNGDIKASGLGFSIGSKFPL